MRQLFILLSVLILFSSCYRSKNVREEKEDTKIDTVEEENLDDTNKFSDVVVEKPEIKTYPAFWNNKMKSFTSKDLANKAEALATYQVSLKLFIERCVFDAKFSTVYSKINSLSYPDDNYQPHPEVSNAIGDLLGDIAFSISDLSEKGTECQMLLDEAQSLVRSALTSSDCASYERAMDCKQKIESAQSLYDQAKSSAKAEEAIVKKQLTTMFK